MCAAQAFFALDTEVNRMEGQIRIEAETSRPRPGLTGTAASSLGTEAAPHAAERAAARRTPARNVF